ncbi:hypothetical protein TeGR_g6785, partial [Tetraparma gracilis]
MPTLACHCGLHSLPLPPSSPPLYHCPCRSCRLTSGSLLSSFLVYPSSAIPPLPAAARYESSPGVTRRFCAACSCSLTCAVAAKPGLLYVFAGATSGVTPSRAVGERLIFAGEASALAGGLLDACELPRHPGWGGVDGIGLGDLDPAPPAADLEPAAELEPAADLDPAPPLPPPPPAPAVLFCGVSCLDRVRYLPSPLLPNAKQTASSAADLPGGNAANAACVAGHLLRGARLGARLLSGVGADPAGELCRRSLAAAGVDAALVRGRGGATLSCEVLVEPGGDRAIVSPPLSDRPRGLEPGDLPRLDEVLRGVRLLATDCRFLPLLVPLAAKARELGIPVLAELETRSSAAADRPLLLRLLKHATHVVATEAYVARFYGADPPSLFRDAPSCSLLVVTGGPPGCTVHAPSSPPLFVPSPPLPPGKLVDSTGAGDAFLGALACLLALGRAPLEAARGACRAGGGACGWRGGRGGEGEWGEVGETVRGWGLLGGGARALPPPPKPPPKPTRAERYKGPAEAEMSGAQLEIYERIRRTRSTGVAGPFGPWLANADVARHASELGLACRYGLGSYDPRLSELAILATAAGTEARAEWDVHAPEALRAGVPGKVVEAVEATWGSRGPADPAAFGEDAAAAAVYAFAEELCRTRRVGDERYAAVKGRFGDVGAVEL